MYENSVPPQHHPEYYLCVPGPGPTSPFTTILPKEAADSGVQANAVDANSGELENNTRVDDPAFVVSSRPTRVVAAVCREPFLN